MKPPSRPGLAFQAGDTAATPCVIRFPSAYSTQVIPSTELACLVGELLQGIEQPSQNGMEHPVSYVARVTKFLDHLIQEHGEYLFVGFVFLCLLIIAWIVVRRRKRPVHEVPVVILPLGNPPRREPDPEPPPFEEHPDD